MSYFKLDVSNIKNLLLNYEKTRKSYIDNVDLFCNSISNIDSVWHDTNSQIFTNKVSLDKSKVLEYINSIDMLYDNISSFLEELQTVCIRFGYTNNLKTLKFDDSQYSKIKQKLSNIIYYLNNSIYQINNYIVGSDFSNMNVIYKLREQLYSSVRLSNSIVSNIDAFINRILTLLNNAISQVNKIKNVELSIEKINYVSRVVDIN